MLGIQKRRIIACYLTKKLKPTFGDRLIKGGGMDGDRRRILNPPPLIGQELLQDWVK
jgi:hypothetical protein